MSSTMAKTSDVTVGSLEDLSPAYRSLTCKLRAITRLERVQGVLSYDQLVFMAHTDETSQERGAQLAALAAVVHEKETDPEILRLIEKVEEELKSTTDNKFVDEARLLQIQKKDFLEHQRVSSELAAKSAALKAKAYSAWMKARENNDFASFEPILSDCFHTAKEVANAKRGDRNISIYTQMLDEYEMGLSPDRIDHVFDEIQQALVPLLAKVLASPTNPNTEPLRGNFPVDEQKELGRKIVTQLGYDPQHGRIDVSAHPFTNSFSPSDVRITSRFAESEWYQGLAGMIHEGGHAMYEQNLQPSALKIDTALSMGTHESQSLFWERHVGMSQPFWRWATPLLQETFDGFRYTAQEVYAAVNVVSRSLIRVEADELTYPLHVILRYHMERDIVEGRMDIKDMPEKWNRQMKELLDVTVPSDSKGCLQDIHWSAMAIGYFPTYLIGSAMAAQLAHYCRQDIPDFDAMVEAGNFAAIKAWLTDKVHRHGKRFPSLDDLLLHQLGEKLNPKYFIHYLTTKYSLLYQC